MLRAILFILLQLSSLALLYCTTQAQQEESHQLVRELLIGHQEVLQFAKDIDRVAVNDEDILSFELLNGRELLVQSRNRGRTNIIVWFADGTQVSYSYIVGLHANSTAQVMQQAISGLSNEIGRNVKVSRVMRGAVLKDNPQYTAPDSSKISDTSSTAAGMESQRKLNEQDDLYILEGIVPNQVALAKILALSASIIRSEEPDFKVLADEGGGLLNRTAQSSRRSPSNSESLSERGPSIGRSVNSLSNRISSNPARATVVSGASGQLLSLLEVQDVPRIRITIRLLEVNLNKLREFDSQLNTSAADAAPPSPVIEVLPPFSRDPTSTLFAPLPGSRPNVFGALQAISGVIEQQTKLSFSRFALDAAFSLLVREGIARSLAEPNISLLSGEVASILVGGEIPLQFATSTAVVVAQNIRFETFGVALQVRALVGKDQKITLDLVPSISQPVLNSFSNVDAPAFEVRTLSTTAQVDDGTALMIGGLTQHQRSFAKQQIPGIADLPFLGWFFSEIEAQDTSNDLVILVVPVIERRASPLNVLWKYPLIEWRDV